MWRQEYGVVAKDCNEETKGSVYIVNQYFNQLNIDAQNQQGQKLKQN
jgi:hypothetical protein